MTTPEDTTKTTADITTINIAESRFNRFDDEFIDKWFNEQGKQAIQDYITLHTQKAVDNKMASLGLKKGVKYKVMSTDKITVLEPQPNPTEAGGL